MGQTLDQQYVGPTPFKISNRLRWPLSFANTNSKTENKTRWEIQTLLACYVYTLLGPHPHALIIYCLASHVPSHCPYSFILDVARIGPQVTNDRMLIEWIMVCWPIGETMAHFPSIETVGSNLTSYESQISWIQSFSTPSGYGFSSLIDSRISCNSNSNG